MAWMDIIGTVFEARMADDVPKDNLSGIPSDNELKEILLAIQAEEGYPTPEEMEECFQQEIIKEKDEVTWDEDEEEEMRIAHPPGNANDYDEDFEEDFDLYEHFGIPSDTPNDQAAALLEAAMDSY